MNNTNYAGRAVTARNRITVDTVPEIIESEFNSTYYNRKPVLIKGALKNSRACQLWTPGYLKSKIGNRIVKFAYNEASNFSDAIRDIKWLDGAVSEILDLITMSTNANSFFAYMGQQSIPDHFPELIPDLHRPDYIKPTDYSGDNNIWIGPAGCRAGLHYDNYHNFFCQIKGTKEIALFSPGDSPYLYASKVPGKRRISEVEIDNVDEHRFPLFSKAVDNHCIVEAGDILYMPFGWWHDILTLELSISVNFWWQRFDVPQSGIEFLELHEIYGIITYFLDKGFPVDQKDQEGESLLIKAIVHRYPQIVEALLQMGANPNVESSVYSPGRSALSFARELEQDRMLELLRRHGAKELV